MKIDTQPTRFPYTSMHVDHKQEPSFDRLLDVAGTERKDDDYYWQHQAQLQQSALTFNPLVREIKSSRATSENVTMEQEPPPNSVTSKIEATRLSINQDISIPVNTTLSEHDVLQFITRIKTTLEPNGSFLEGDRTDKSTVNDKSEQTRDHQKLRENSLFKNYQLFLNDNKVELTLNTSHLSKQQANELQKLIKQWLTQKGYSLKLLRINGEQQ